MTYFAMLSEAKEKLSNRLAEFNGFGGVGLTANDGQRVLVVYIEDGQENDIKPHIPEEIDGVPVVTCIKGNAQLLSM